MTDLRLYKDFYRINHSSNGELYTSFNPFSISATVINRTNSAITEVATIIQESTGLYYAILTPSLYSYTNVYEVLWNVTYINGTTAKTLKTIFKIDPNNSTGTDYGNIISNIEIDIENNRIIDYVLNDSEILIEIK